MLRNVNERIQVLEWNENITLKNVEEFRQEMGKFTNGDKEYFILNLSNTDYINSAGLGIIADSVIHARKNQKELVISEVEQAVQEIFSIVKFSTFMKVFKTEKEAIEYLSENEHAKE